MIPMMFSPALSSKSSPSTNTKNKKTIQEVHGGFVFEILHWLETIIVYISEEKEENIFIIGSLAS